MSKPETWKSWEGSVVEGKFPLRQYLGGSDHSAVFLTEIPKQPSQKAAIKLIQLDQSDAEVYSARLRSNIKISHPHLIRILESGRCSMNGATVYVVMECADDDLSQILPERPLESGEVSELLPPVLDALAFLHKNGLVHGRIKPSNVLAVGNQLKLSSDQVASVAEQDGRRRRRDVYDAPETAAGIVSPSGDIWSVGATIVAALTQNVALAEQGSPSGSRGLPESIPEPFRGIAKECLQLDPKRRSSLAEIQARLRPQARTVAAPAEPAETRAEKPNRRPAIAIAALAVIVIGIIVAMLYSRANRTPAQNVGAMKQPATDSAPAPAPPVANPKTVKPAPKPHASGGEVVRQVLPDVPRSAQNTIRGTIKVVVRVQVDPSGKVNSATLKSAGSSRYFANQALKAAQKWEFSAPEVDGQPQASTWLLQFRFKRSSIQVSPEKAKG